MSGIDIRRSARRKRWPFDSFERIKCSNRAIIYEPHPLLNKSSFDSRPSCSTDDTSQQSSNMGDRNRRSSSYRTVASNARKTWVDLDESCSIYGGSPAKSILKDCYQKDTIDRDSTFRICGERKLMDGKNESERTVTTHEMHEDNSEEDREMDRSHPSLIQEAALQLTSARAWLEKWEAAKQSSPYRGPRDGYPTSPVNAKRVSTRLVESKVLQSLHKPDEDSECTCSIVYSEPPQTHFNRLLENCFLQKPTQNRCNDSVTSDEEEEYVSKQKTRRSHDDGSWFSQEKDNRTQWCPSTATQQDDDSLFKSVIQGADSLPHNFDDYLGDDDQSEPPLVRSRTVDEGECSPPRQQHYKRRSPCALYPWRNRDSGLPLERDPKVASVSSEIHPANVDRSEDFCQEDLMPEPKLICRPSPLACLQRNVSDPLHQSKTVQIHQRSRSDPVFSFHNDVLADETEVTSPEEDDDFCALNRNPDRISEGMPDVFTGSRFDDISTIGGEADDERPSSDYRKRRPVLSWFHQGPYTSSSRRNEDCLKEDFDMSSPARIPRSSRRMVDEGDWSLDVPRRGSKTECEI